MSVPLFRSQAAIAINAHDVELVGVRSVQRFHYVLSGFVSEMSSFIGVVDIILRSSVELISEGGDVEEELTTQSLLDLSQRFIEDVDDLVVVTEGA